MAGGQGLEEEEGLGTAHSRFLTSFVVTGRLRWQGDNGSWQRGKKTRGGGRVGGWP